MPFGLKNGPATFQRIMDNILRECLWKFCNVYLDDIVIYSKNIDEHYKHLSIVLEKIKEANIKLNLKKCVFFVDEIDLLGYRIKKGYIYLDNKRGEAIINCREPKSFKELQSFLGLVNYNRDFVPRLAEMAEPLYYSLRKKSFYLQII